MSGINGYGNAKYVAPPDERIGAILRSYVNVNVPDFFKDQGGYTHLLHAFATREFRKDLTITERSSS